MAKSAAFVSYDQSADTVQPNSDPAEGFSLLLNEDDGFMLEGMKIKQ